MAKYRGSQLTPLLLKDFAAAIQKTLGKLDRSVEQVGLLVVMQDIVDFGYPEQQAYLRGGCIPVVNSNSNPAEHFSIDRAAFRQVQALPDVLAVVGVVHTHSEFPQPSHNDIKGIPPDLVGCVYQVRTQSLMYYTCDGLPKLVKQNSSKRMTGSLQGQALSFTASY